MAKTYFARCAAQSWTRLVEDEKAIRELACRVLGSCGYTVIAAENGAEGVSKALDHSDGLALIVTDVVMPETGGRMLVDTVREFLPHIKALFMSGYTDDEVVRRGVVDGEAEFLQKPFTPVQLAQKVREVLDRAYPATEGPERPARRMN